MLQANGITYEIETPDGPLKLLDNVSFNVPRGHFMAVVGPSGCGKTTLLKAIAGMIAETGGRFFWNGHDLAEEDFEPSEIGFVPQFSIAYDQLSVDENVESAARLRCRFNSVDDLDDSIDNALEVTGMEGITDRDVKILSGGQKRRLALAMELVSNPRLLICDEVTSGLDPRSEHDIVFLLHEISRSEGRIVISVTHSLSHLDRYDSILVMHQGCVAYHGSPKTMLHYFGVSSLEEIYPKLQDREGPSWSRSWSKHRDSYYSRLEQEREKKILSGELPDPDAVRLAEAEKEGASGESGTEREHSGSSRIFHPVLLPAGAALAHLFPRPFPVGSSIGHGAAVSRAGSHVYGQGLRANRGAFRHAGCPDCPEGYGSPAAEHEDGIRRLRHHHV